MRGRSERFRILNEQSLFRRRTAGREEFLPQKVEEDHAAESFEDFILHPLYTKRELLDFYRRNTRGGAFAVTEDTVRTMEDLEKLFFVWQEATEIADGTKEILIHEELKSEEGFRFSRLEIRE